jgi:meiotic recombination protein SPO11
MSSSVSSSNRGRVRARPDEPKVAAAAAPSTPVETVGSKKRVVVQRAKDADIVLAQCRKLHKELIAKAAATELSGVARAIPDGIPSNIVEVSELPEAQVLEGMEVIALQVAHQVLSKKGFSMEVPSRAASNQVYVKEWDRIVLGGKRSSRTFLNVKEARKSAITLRVMQLLHAVLLKRIHITKRDLFYTDVKLFVDQADSDGVLDDVATIIGCTRSNLHVVASDKGLVVGRIQFEEDGDFIDCTKMGVGGKAIPPYIDKIENITSDAEFILLVEKEAAYMRMAVSPVGSLSSLVLIEPYG